MNAPTNPHQGALRDRLHASARGLALHGDGAEAVIRRARRRRARHRTGTAVAAFGVIAAGAGGVYVRSQQPGLPVSSGAEPLTLPVLPPLDLAWRRAENGLFGPAPVTYSVDATGVIYAVSTAPGTGGDPTTYRYGQYRLGEDGSWSPVTAAGDTTWIADVAAADGILYGSGTAPGTGGSVLTSSADGGATWATTPLPPVPPPSDAVEWRRDTAVAVEHIPGATVALVTTTFSLTHDQLLELAPSPDHALATTGFHGTAQGLEALGVPRDPTTGGTLPPRTPGTKAPNGAYGDVIYTIPWSRLGVSGPQALHPVAQLLAPTADGWAPIDTAGSLAGITAPTLQAAGDHLVVRGAYTGDDLATRPVTLVSRDGRQWREMTGMYSFASGRIGSTWVTAAHRGNAGSVIKLSADDGASWHERELGAIDPRLAGAEVQPMASGPLGVAAIARMPAGRGPAGGGEQYLLITRDLQTWSVVPIDDLPGGEGVAAITVAVGADRIVVGGVVPSGQPIQPAVTLVGTPTR